MATFHAVILKGKVHVKQDGTSNIKIRITHRGKVEYLSTDLFVQPKKFKKGYATGENANYINGRIRDELNKYTKRYLKLGSLPEKLTVKELREKVIIDPEMYDIDFYKFADNYKDELIARGKTGSARGLNGILHNLKKFRTTLYFSEITLSFLNEFYEFLTQQGIKNARDNYMREFRLLFREGMNRYNDEERGLIKIPHYPFRLFRFKRITKEKRNRRLTLEQLRAIRDYSPDREREQMAKDMFMLMFYLIGVNTKDLYYMLPADNRGRISFNRAKTHREYSIKVEPEALLIIEKYKGAKRLINANKRYSNYLNWQKYINQELKKIGQGILKKMIENDPKAEFPSDIATNWARHTWATIARNNCGIDKDTVALCLGHKDQDNRVTDVYIEYDYSIIDEANRKVLDLVKQTLKAS